MVCVCVCVCVCMHMCVRTSAHLVLQNLRRLHGRGNIQPSAWDKIANEAEVRYVLIDPIMNLVCDMAQLEVSKQISHCAMVLLTFDVHAWRELQ